MLQAFSLKPETQPFNLKYLLYPISLPVISPTKCLWHCTGVLIVTNLMSLLLLFLASKSCVFQYSIQQLTTVNKNPKTRGLGDN